MSRCAIRAAVEASAEERKVGNRLPNLLARSCAARQAEVSISRARRVSDLRAHLRIARPNLLFASGVARSEGNPGSSSRSWSVGRACSANRSKQACSSSLSWVRCERGTLPPMPVMRARRSEGTRGIKAERNAVDDDDAIFVCWTLESYRAIVSWRGEGPFAKEAYEKLDSRLQRELLLHRQASLGEGEYRVEVVRREHAEDARVKPHNLQSSLVSVASSRQAMRTHLTAQTEESGDHIGVLSHC